MIRKKTNANKEQYQDPKITTLTYLQNGEAGIKELCAFIRSDYKKACCLPERDISNNIGQT